MLIWAGSLVVKMKKQIRLLASFILVTGVSIATWTFSTLSDTTMVILGFACLAGLVIYIMFLILDLLGPPRDLDESEEISPLEAEAVVQ
jgi:hypothetical protein